MKSPALRRESSPVPFLVSRRPAIESAERNLGKGILAGLAGGLIGTIVMTQFQNAWSKASQALKGDDGGQQAAGAPKQAREQQSEDATMKAAGRLAELGGRQLSHEQKKTFGLVVHYSFGTLQGGVNGAVAESAGVEAGLLHGILFGAALFAAADEIAVPALRLSGKPTAFPLSSHLYGLASHLVYGVTAEIARRGLRAAL